MIVCLGTSPTLQRTMVFGTITAGDVNRSDRVHDFASGKATNAARVLHTLGRPVKLLTVVGGDQGRLFLADLERLGLPCEAVEVDVPTRQCVTVVDEGRRQATELVQEPGELTPAHGEALLERLANLLDQATVLVMSGKLPRGLPPDLLGRATAMATERGIKTVLDARREPLREALAAHPTFIKPNRGELANTVGRPIDSRSAMHDAMAMLVERGAGQVVCTRGRDGSSLCARDGDGRVRYWEISTPVVEAVSPVGSGDAYAARLAAGLDDGAGPTDACRFASACGAANAVNEHAGHLDPAEAERLLSKVGVREVT